MHFRDDTQDRARHAMNAEVAIEVAPNLTIVSVITLDAVDNLRPWVTALTR
jgi:molybdopterin-binding protein